MTAPSAATTRKTNRARPQWNVPAPVDPGELSKFAAGAGTSVPAARVLWNRGLRDVQAARDFLSPTLDLLHDPMLMLGMDRAVDRLLRAVREGEKILIYGDYDVDGTSSIVILKKAIELAGGEADYHVPHRLREGYGMRPEVLAEAAARGARRCAQRWSARTSGCGGVRGGKAAVGVAGRVPGCATYKCRGPDGECQRCDRIISYR